MWKLNIEEDIPKKSLLPESIITFSDFGCTKENFISFQWDVIIIFLVFYVKASKDFLLAGFSNGKLLIFNSNSNKKDYRVIIR